MKKLKMITGFGIIVLTIFIGYLLYEIGGKPSAKELVSFQKLPYFKNKKFHNNQITIKTTAKSDPEDKFNIVRLLFTKMHAPKKPLPLLKLDKNSFLEKSVHNVIYWLGHTSTIIELEGKRIGIDLVFGNASPLPFTVKRYQNSPLKREDLPELDYIILTHNHYDHLERKTIQSIKKGRFIIPYGLKMTLQKWGIPSHRIVEIGWHESFEENNLKITAVESIHFSSRSLLDRNKTLWNSYVIQTPKYNIFWGGDGGYGKHFLEIGKKYGPFDWAALEIDAWNFNWPEIHLFPDQVVQATVDLRAKRLLPIHWGAYNLGAHLWNKSINLIVNASINQPFELMLPKMGEKLIPGKTKTPPWW